MTSYVCYNNEAYMNTGVQRSSATPPGASTMTSPVGAHLWGEDRPSKDLPAIAMAHRIPYVATASIAFPPDLKRKVKRAMTIRGPKYIEVHSPCPIGWGYDPAETIELGKLAVQTGLVPLFEAAAGEPMRVHKLRRRLPVSAYLERQKRFSHLFETGSPAEHLAAIQEIADDNAARLGLEDRAAAAEESALA
jgi:pyruvate ferredoxin oxidoreductase beta subunit